MGATTLRIFVFDKNEDGRTVGNSVDCNILLAVCNWHICGVVLSRTVLQRLLWHSKGHSNLSRSSLLLLVECPFCSKNHYSLLPLDLYRFRNISLTLVQAME